MDKSAVRKIVNDHVWRMRWALQLQDWKIDVVYGHVASEFTKGTCTPDPRYKNATIEIDPEKADDEKDVLATLRHELIHILIADFETYRLSVAQLLTDNVFNAVDEFFRHASETFVGRVERALEDGMGIGVEKMCEGSAKTEAADTDGKALTGDRNESCDAAEQ